MTPQRVELPEGSTQRFLVLASYSDGTVEDVTARAIIRSSNEEIVKRVPGAGAARFEAKRLGAATIVVQLEAHTQRADFNVVPGTGDTGS